MERVSRDAERWDRVRHWRATRVRIKRQRIRALRTHRGAQVGNPSGNRRLGRRMAAQRGWRGGQWTCLRVLWHGESGWRNDARNPSSHAGGIPQALPARKMGLGRWPHYVSKVRGQIAWGLRYIARRYGSPCRALAFWRSKSPSWY